MLFLQCLRDRIEMASAKRKPLNMSMGSSNNSRLPAELTDEQKADLAEAFHLLDVEGVNNIGVKDLKVALRALGYEPPKDEDKKIMSEIEKDSMSKSNTLNAEEFERTMKAKLFDYENQEEIAIAFPLFTEGKKDFITIDDLRRIAKELGENVPDEVLEEMIREADVLDHDGQISKEEFFRVMKRENAY